MKLTLTDMIALSRAIDCEENYPSPSGLQYLPFQKVAIKWISLFDKVLIADPPGAGKTIEIAGAINNERPDRTIIFAPASLLKNWRKELTKWMIRKVPIYTWKQFKKLPIKPAIFIILISFYYAGKKDAFFEILSLKSLDFLVIDETHNLKNLKAKQTKLLLAKNGPISISKKVISMTGTPIVNRPIELYPILKRLSPHLIQDINKFEFGMKYCAGWLTPWGVYDFSGASNLKELGTILRSGFMLHRNKKQILPQLPPVTRAIVYLDAEAPRTLAYEAKNVRNTGAVAFEETSVAHQELGLFKLPLAIEYIKTQLMSGHKKIVVFAHHRPVMKGLFDGLKEFNPVVYMGGMSETKKDNAVTKFQEDPTCHLFLGSLLAAGVGLTLTAASYVIIVEADYRPGINDQAIDRLDRIGQLNPVQADFLVIENTMDERKLKINLNKRDNAREFLS